MKELSQGVMAQIARQKTSGLKGPGSIPGQGKTNIKIFSFVLSWLLEIHTIINSHRNGGKGTLFAKDL